MTQFILPKGSIVLIDDEDVPILESSRWEWLIWRPRSSQSWGLWREEVANGCRFRVPLHRLVALQMEPRMAVDPARYTVRAINRDYMDVRRENLAISFRTRGSGALPRNRKPAGNIYARDGFAIGTDHISPLWSGGVIWRRNTSLEARKQDDRMQPYLIASQRFLHEYRTAPQRGDEPGGDPLD